MTFKIRWSPKAMDSLVTHAGWWAAHHSEQQGLRFFDGFVNAVDTLAELPLRCPLAPENSVMDFELRQLHFGTGSHSTHRALFTIDQKNQTVTILLVRRHSQRGVSADDLEE